MFCGGSKLGKMVLQNTSRCCLTERFITPPDAEVKFLGSTGDTNTNKVLYKVDSRQDIYDLLVTLKSRGYEIFCA